MLVSDVQASLDFHGTISIIIPVLNEEKAIAKTLSEIPLKELEKMGYKCEILVVDGGSKDKTREIARKCGARVIVEPRPGYGIAYKTGFANARGDIIATLDGDFSYPACFIPQLVKLLETGKYDFISTNRMENFTKGSMSRVHLLGNKVLTYFTRVLFRVSLKDSQSGMWVFKKNLLDKVVLSAKGMSFSEEIKIVAFKFFRAAEFPIPYRKRIGKQKLRTVIDGLKNLAYLLNLRLFFSSLLNVPVPSNMMMLKAMVAYRNHPIQDPILLGMPRFKML
ncbi:glycosyltransferase family 2 protein [Candidatus Bathyarchaeota archaeon]|nr:MAG: glycosyltransferase family 2 protein [Candidatus Bathyarchaeota archaeon]